VRRRVEGLIVGAHRVGTGTVETGTADRSSAESAASLHRPGGRVRPDARARLDARAARLDARAARLDARARHVRRDSDVGQGALLLGTVLLMLALLVTTVGLTVSVM
jgi:hypothetical protein